MTIFKGSRFRTVKSGLIVDSNKEVNRVFALYETTTEPPAQSSIYTVKAGDTFESIAAREYGDGNKWYILGNVNPTIFWPLDLVAGMRIFVPPKSYAELT